jgi:hypothetical protein
VKECPCCHCKTLERRAQWEICPVCFWEDDGHEEPEVCSPPNHGLTLTQGRANYLAIGACEREMLRYCRKPTAAEVPLDTQSEGDWEEGGGG